MIRQFLENCPRLADWASIGPVQRAELAKFAANISEYVIMPVGVDSRERRYGGAKSSIFLIMNPNGMCVKISIPDELFEHENASEAYGLNLVYGGHYE